MAIRSFPFNSVNGDRMYFAEDFTDYFSKFISNGVFPNPSTNLQVMANNDMTVTIKTGSAYINGVVFNNTDDYVLELEPADGVLSRIDRITLRLDRIKREIYPYVKQGEYATNPSPKELQRDADAYELGLADVNVNKGAISITQADITDLRLNTELCGIVHGTVEQVDTTTLFEQYKSWYKQRQEEYETDLVKWTKNKKNEYNTWYSDTTTSAETDIETTKQQFERDFTVWFDSIKDVLDESTAGNLLNLINAKMDKKIPDESYSDRRYEFTVIKGKPYLRTVN